MKRKKETDELKIPFLFDYTELTAIEEYLTEQEKNGLRLVGIEGKCFVFKKSSPREIRYCAEIYKGSLLSDFKAACEEEGWECIGIYNGELFIFATQDPDACEIMTDDKEKFKVIAKRVLLQPGYLGFQGWVILHFINQFVFRSDYAPLIEANIYDWICIVCAGFHLTYIVTKFIDFFVWLSKSKKYVKKGEKIPFSDLKKHRQDSRANCIAMVISAFLCIATILYLLVGYVESDWLVPMCGVFVLFGALNLVYDYNKRKNDGETSRAAHIIAIMVAAVIIAGTFATVQYNRKMFEENTEHLFNNNSIPVSLSDFGIEENDCEDATEYVYATRLAQQYFFSSEYENASENGESYYLHYQVLVSDSPEIRQRYINCILRNYERFGTPIMEIDDSESEWDEYYREFEFGEMIMSGFAVKDNIVVFLYSCCMDEKQDFFGVAYEKLFAESK